MNTPQEEIAHKSIMKTASRKLAESDTKLKRLIDIFGPPELGRGGDPYQALVRSIISQQISWKAARAIRERFLALFPDTEFPSPQVLAQASPAEIRQAGLSQRKSEYVVGIAQAFSDPDFLGNDMDDLSDEDVSARLTSIRGVGQWTADMFMIFTLARLDILPLNDQGIKNGLKAFFKLDHHPDPAEMLVLTEHWKPYRSVASWYMWKVVDEDFQWDED